MKHKEVRENGWFSVNRDEIGGGEASATKGTNHQHTLLYKERRRYREIHTYRMKKLEVKMTERIKGMKER